MLKAVPLLFDGHGRLDSVFTMLQLFWGLNGYVIVHFCVISAEYECSFKDKNADDEPVVNYIKA